LTTVVIAEDSVLLREGLGRLLVEYGAEVLAMVGDAEEAIAAVEEHQPDLLITDVRMPPTFTDEGIRAAQRLREDNPELAVLVLSQYVESVEAARLLASGSGIGYILKDRVTRLQELGDVIERLMSGGNVVDPEVIKAVFTSRQQRDRLAALTERERDVLALIAQGQSNHGIATTLFITEGVVEKHISAIMTKLDLPQTPSTNRRALAVLTWVQANP